MWIAVALCVTTLLTNPSPQTAEQAAAEGETPLALEIDAVTLYRNSAMVHRRAKALSSGDYVVRDLPGEVSDSRTRVRFIGGHVISVELRERVLESAPQARVEALRVERRDARLRLREAQDVLSLEARSGDYLARLLAEEGEAWRRELAAGTADTEGWASNRAWFQDALNEAKQAQRVARTELRAAEDRLRGADKAWGELTAGGGVIVQDLHLRIVTDEAAGRLEVDTQLPAAGWEPRYDLRTAGNAQSVELVYRANLWQRTGEDWTDVQVMLSTAQPELGAQGPDPVARWVDLYSPRGRSGYLGESDAVSIQASLEAPAEEAEDLDGFTEVLHEGLSVRYALPARETIESRDAPTSVLVGREQLAVEPEHYCAPALSPIVWLRGRATNTGRWTLLPGEVSVFFGADFLGHARLDLVQPGQQFMLHLGAVEAFEVKRTRVKDLAEGPGFFGSKRAQVEEWSIELTNHGASIADTDGTALVLVQEALPRAGEDQIDVVVESERPKHLTNERWLTDLEDRSIHTWLLRVPRGKSAVLGYRVSVRYPKSADIFVEQS